jgi:hypothetical protein
MGLILQLIFGVTSRKPVFEASLLLAESES